MQPDDSGFVMLAFVLVGGFFALFLTGVGMLVYLANIRDDMRMVKSLIAAFMEHKVADTVAENRLATLVQEANKVPAVK